MSKVQDVLPTLPKPKIELYSGQYFAACGLGGIIGTSLFHIVLPVSSNVFYSLWPYTHSRHTARLSQM